MSSLHYVQALGEGVPSPSSLEGRDGVKLDPLADQLVPRRDDVAQPPLQGAEVRHGRHIRRAPARPGRLLTHRGST
jgi:hypothetical protein